MKVKGLKVYLFDGAKVHEECREARELDRPGTVFKV
jgi:hypothetical protein